MSEFVKCTKCGKEFKRRSKNQMLCYDPCVPLAPSRDMFDAAKVKQDCIMYHDDGTKTYCSGLQDVYCGYCDCRFYKSGRGKEDAK